MSAAPIFHIIAGPNGAGKSTLYRTLIQPTFPSAEFVNADLLAQAHYGKAATTREESETGQRLAETRRRELMAARKSLVTESTFSHPSKLDLVRDAIALGYEVRVYHVNLRSPDLAVKRVERRVGDGGHPVPEDKTRERYTRNQPIIRDAVRLAHRAYVFDNSEFGQPHRRVLAFQQGQAVYVDRQVPAWARELYAGELRGYAAERLNRPAASFETAKRMTQAQLGEAAVLRIARLDSSRYVGKIIAETDLHVVQQLGDRSAVAHFKSLLSPAPALNDSCAIAYRDGRASVTAVASTRPPAAAQPAKGGCSYVGTIREITATAVVQDVDGGNAITHEKHKLYKLGGGLDAALGIGKRVSIAYGAAGVGQVTVEAETLGAKRGPKR
ncbi:MAG: hypothetical protein RL684_854 [Pseudomonadota bacterium]